jgi:cytochrome c-type biogenesis protein CcmH/NrfF
MAGMKRSARRASKTRYELAFGLFVFENNRKANILQGTDTSEQAHVLDLTTQFHSSDCFANKFTQSQAPDARAKGAGLSLAVDG